MQKKAVHAAKRNYEIAFLIKEGDIAKTVVERIKEHLAKAKGEFVGENDMGTRQLAYEIFKNRDKFVRAYYYFLKAQMEPTNVTEFERQIKIDEDIIRHMVLVED